MTSNFTAIETTTLPWEERTLAPTGQKVYRKALFTDPETGCYFQLVRYPSGVINPRHVHPCAHAIYVLEGHLETHRGTYGPGSFVWFPEGEVMEHGATAREEVVVLLVSNKPFSIQYVP